MPVNKTTVFHSRSISRVNITLEPSPPRLRKGRHARRVFLELRLVMNCSPICAAATMAGRKKMVRVDLRDWSARLEIISWNIMSKPPKASPQRKRSAALADRKRFMQMAVDLAEQTLDAGKGGPFGAIVVRVTRIVVSSGNCVFKHTDPTAHAEIMAIRDACENLRTDDLTGCDIYSSGEPCPMCMAAIYWAKIDAVYYCNTEKDALRYGFVDKLILAELRKDPSERRIKSKRIGNPGAIRVFKKAAAAGIRY